jgi:hypothetical protein
MTKTERSQVVEDADELFHIERDLGQAETKPSDPVEAQQEEYDDDDYLNPFRERQQEEEEPSNDLDEEANSSADESNTSKPVEPYIVLLCDCCDKRIENAHMHGGVCDGGEFNLCIPCADNGAYCSGGARGEHPMAWRFVSEMPKPFHVIHTTRNDADVRRMLSSREPRPYGSKKTPVPEQAPPEPLPPTSRPPRPYVHTQTKTEPKDPMIKMIVNGNTYDFIANRKFILSSNTSYFANNAREDTQSMSGRQYGLYVNFKGEQYSMDVLWQ